MLSNMSPSSGSVVKMADPYADTQFEVEDSFSTNESLISVSAEIGLKIDHNLELHNIEF